MAPTDLRPRFFLGDDGDDGWWYSDTAIIIKWTIGAVILFALTAYFGGGYIHAKSRMAKGLQPLPYHRWMVRRQMEPEAYVINPSRGPRVNTHGGYAEAYQPPPPVYNPYNAPPPEYYPNNMQDIPLNPAKISPNQGPPQISGTTSGEASGSSSRPT
ncbi:hypothetical protein DRE_05970 [Drechslerella stenobrocha 248]|uniref:Uncharacterized protein n=1 Tax=Drechslerella stenobrocha 248 TaxID=1043628 RepID=W7HZ55_9PEZI|nr:hypothetical protein DRE_05970 [Drechslerella stenobrocha 248]